MKSGEIRFQSNTNSTDKTIIRYPTVFNTNALAGKNGPTRPKIPCHSYLKQFLHVRRLIGSRLRFVLVKKLGPLGEVEDHVEGGDNPVGWRGIQ